MYRRRTTSRRALWVFAAALLLKSAMPWLANAAAQRQGKAPAEICTVYGVAPLKPAPDSAPDRAAAHGGDHCALNALAALAGHEPAPASAPFAPRLEAPRPFAIARAPSFDACAAWAATLGHGPPARA